MSHLPTPLLSRNTGNFHFGKPLAMTSLLAKVLAAIEFNNRDFLVATVGNNLSGDLSAFDNRGANLDIISTANHQDLVKLDSFARGSFNFFQLEGLALNDTVLLSTAFNDCVHILLRLISLLAVDKKPFEIKGAEHGTNSS
jgi:hypothetical protein